MQWGKPKDGQAFGVYFKKDVITTGMYGAPEIEGGALGPRWRHVAAVLGAKTLTIYVDGMRVAAATNVAARTAKSPLRMGLGVDNSYPFKGDVDELRIFNRALTPEEIAKIHRIERGAIP